MTDAAYLDLVGAANLIPGPTSTEVAMHLGHRRAGWSGMVVAGGAFILPAVVIVAVLAWAYVTAGTRLALEPVIRGVGPVVIALIVHAGWAIGRTAIRTRPTALLAGLAAAGSLVGLPEILLLLALGAVSVGMAGLTGLLVRRARNVVVGLPLAGLDGRGRGAHPSVDERFVAWAVGPGGPTPLAVLAEFALLGATVFGSGYVLVAYLQAEVVDRLGWITPAQLVDAVAVGQATPGPVFSTATFVGYLAAGPVGAAAATIGIFAPAFVAVALSIPVLERLRASAMFRAFLDGVNAAAVGLLAVVAVRLGLAVLVEPFAWLSAVVAFVLLWRGVPSPLLIVAGAAIGLGRTILGA